MKTKDLTAALAERTSLSAAQTDALLRATMEILLEQLTDNKSIFVQGFGTFEVRKKNERMSVHPATGIRTLIPPKLVINFKQSSTMKEKLKDVKL